MGRGIMTTWSDTATMLHREPQSVPKWLNGRRAGSRVHKAKVRFGTTCYILTPQVRLLIEYAA